MKIIFNYDTKAPRCVPSGARLSRVQRHRRRHPVLAGFVPFCLIAYPITKTTDHPDGR